MAKTTINNNTFTEVLDGAGFCISEVETIYSFGTTPSIEDSFTLGPRGQVNGFNNKTLWAMSVLHAEVDVYSETED